MRFLTFALTVALLGLPTQGSTAGKSKTGAHCPRCHELCQATVAKVMEEKHCWEVECKPICIPRVTFPWQVKNSSKGKDACLWPAHCGRVKYVNVLVKHEYECPKCKYTWNPDTKKGRSTPSNGPSPPADFENDLPPSPPQLEANLQYGKPLTAPVTLEYGSQTTTHAARPLPRF